MKSWTQYKIWLTALAKSIDKSIVLHTKANWFSRALAWIVFVLTVGKVSRASFLTTTATAIANHHLYPDNYTPETVERLIPHEGRHTKQLRLFGFQIHPIVGLPIGLLVYGFLPLPIGLAFGRFYMELDADRASYRHMFGVHGYTLELANWMRGHARHRAETLSGPLYVWAMIKPISKWWYNKMVEEVINEYRSNMG